MNKINIGDVFGRLTVMKEKEERSNDGHKIYICECSCGNITEVRSKELLNGDTISCNCYRKEQVAKRYYDGTQPDRLFSDNINKNNKSGVKGVCWDKARNKWRASFSYQRKTYNLGRYDTIAEAEKARKEFENKIKSKYLR